MSSVGQGSLSFSQKAPVIPAPGPPFPPTSADNGLSVDPVTGRIVLGNDIGDTIAALLSDREIPMDDFLFLMTNNTNWQFVVDPLNGFYGLGDVSGAINGSSIGIDDGNRIAFIAAANDITIGSSSMELHLDGMNSIATLGSSNMLATFDDTARSLAIDGPLGNFLLIDDTNERIEMGVPNIHWEIDNVAQTFRVPSTSGSGVDWFAIDAVNNRAFLSPVGGFSFAPGFYTDGNSFIGYFGSDANVTGSPGISYEVDYSLNNVRIADQNGTRFIVDPGFAAMGFISTGDIDNVYNGLVFSVQVYSGTDFNFSNTNGDSRLVVNGSPGFTGTVTPVTSITVEGGIVTAVS